MPGLSKVTVRGFKGIGRREYHTCTREKERYAQWDSSVRSTTRTESPRTVIGMGTMLS
jgi:hypothetical protein